MEFSTIHIVPKQLHKEKCNINITLTKPKARDKMPNMGHLSYEGCVCIFTFIEMQYIQIMHLLTM